MAKKPPATTKTGQPHKPRSGRPSSYTQKMADDICNDIRRGASLRTALLTDKRPDDVTFYRWIETFPNFRIQYAQATKDRAEAHFEELVASHEIAMEDMKIYEDNPRFAMVLMQVHKLKSDNMKWAMSKMQPKKYGDKQEIDILPLNAISFINEVPNNQPVPNVNKDS